METANTTSASEPSAPPALAGPTASVRPSPDRLIRFSINGYEFGYRRPSRADITSIIRRYAVKVTPLSGMQAESALIVAFDPDVMWDARLEVGLRARQLADGSDLTIGERAPSHWLDGDAISFDNVDPEEFAAVCAYLQPLAWPKDVASPADTEVEKSPETPGVQ